VFLMKALLAISVTGANSLQLVGTLDSVVLIVIIQFVNTRTFSSFTSNVKLSQ
jgi:hypothetical protein